MQSRIVPGYSPNAPLSDRILKLPERITGYVDAYIAELSTNSHNVQMIRSAPPLGKAYRLVVASATEDQGSSSAAKAFG